MADFGVAGVGCFIAGVIGSVYRLGLLVRFIGFGSFRLPPF